MPQTLNVGYLVERWVGARLRKIWWFCLKCEQKLAWLIPWLIYEWVPFSWKMVFGSTFKFLGCISPPRQIRCRKGLNFYFSLFISRGQNKIVHLWFLLSGSAGQNEPHISPTLRTQFFFFWVSHPGLQTKWQIGQFILLMNFYSSEIYSQIDFYFKALSTEQWRVQKQALPLCIWDELLWSWSRKYWRLSWLFVPKYIFNIPNWLMVVGLWLVNFSFYKSWNYLLQD